MEKLLEAIKSGDLVEAKREFAQRMTEIKESVYAAEKVAVARSVMIEGEIKKAEACESDDEDEDEEDE